MKTETRPGDPPPATEPSLGPLLSQLAQDSSELIKQEIALAKSEVKHSVAQAANGAVKLGVAAALLSVGGLVLTAFLVLLLGELLGNYWLASLIVGGVFILVGALLARGGVHRLRELGAPEATIETLKEDRDWAKAEVQQLKRGLKS
jgi:uncharacterized membrane protein YqjE